MSKEVTPQRVGGNQGVQGIRYGLQTLQPATIKLLHIGQHHAMFGTERCCIHD
jgi:hypothetical protein